MGAFYLKQDEFADLEKAMRAHQGNTEKVINNVLHNEAPPIFQEEIYRLMPASGRRWKGKKGAAKTSKSLKSVEEHLAIGIGTVKRYHYLYFPDDGTNTRHHVGNQQFFFRGVNAKKEEVVNRCINNLVNDIEK